MHVFANPVVLFGVQSRQLYNMYQNGKRQYGVSSRNFF